MTASPSARITSHHEADRFRTAEASEQRDLEAIRPQNVPKPNLCDGTKRLHYR